MTPSGRDEGSERPVSPPTAKSARFALFLSGLVWPGAGQFAQRRWVAGAVYATGFLACFLASAVNAARILILHYTLTDPATELSEGDVAGLRPRVVRMVLFFVLGLVVFVANLVDAALAGARSRRGPPPLPRDGGAGPSPSGG